MWSIPHENFRRGFRFSYFSLVCEPPTLCCIGGAAVFVRVATARDFFAFGDIRMALVCGYHALRNALPR